MKTLAAFAVLLVLGTVPARAEDDDKLDALRGEIEVSQLERDVDKELLREALVLAGRARMGQAAKRLDSDEAKKRYEAELVVLEEFIQGKKDALVKRAVELKKKAAELTAATRKANRPNLPVKPADDKDRPELIEKLEESQVESQLLQTQSQMYQQKLNEALNTVATAEFTASIDETQREKADAARKEFNDFRKKYVDFSKKLRLEQEKVAELLRRLGVGGIGGMGRGFQ